MESSDVLKHWKQLSSLTQANCQLLTKELLNSFLDSRILLISMEIAILIGKRRDERYFRALDLFGFVFAVMVFTVNHRFLVNFQVSKDSIHKNVILSGDGS